MKYFTITIAIILLITAIFDIDVSYWYYQLLKWFVFINAGANAYYYQKSKKMLITFSIIALLFNPIMPIYFPKTVWKIIDGIVGIFLLFNLFKNKPYQFLK